VRCHTYLKTIKELWPVLTEALVPGTLGEGPDNPAPSASEVEALRAERAERQAPRTKPPVYLPDAAAPVNLAVSMALADARVMLASAHHDAQGIVGLPRRCRRCNHDLMDHGGRHGAGCGLCEPCTAYQFTEVRADSPVWESLMAAKDPEVADAIEGLLWKAKSLMEGAVDTVEPGKLILAPCPWCHGKNDAMPTGSLSLRVYMPGGAPETYVLCLNPGCDPSPEACGSRFRGRPMWRFHELGWLSDRVDDAFEREQQRLAMLNEMHVAS